MCVHNTINSSVAKSFFPSPIIRTMPSNSNLKELASYKASAPKENRAMIDHLIELYSNKKIHNSKTVENAVTRLFSHTKSKATQTKAVREYDITAKKYKDALPTSGRIQRQILEKRKKVLSKVLSITLILFRLADAGDAKATISVPGVSGDKANGEVRKEAKKEQENVEKDSAKARRKYGKLEQFYIGSFDLRVSADDEAFLKLMENK
jgi:hypothetical protein